MGNRDISDLTYKKMSSEAYNDFKTNKIDSLPGWEIIDQKHNSSGMDVVTFYKPDTKQAVIAFRGTEGSSTWDRKAPDLKADVLNIGLPEIGATINRAFDDLRFPLEKEISKGIEDSLGLSQLEDWLGDTQKNISKGLRFENQLYEAEDYVKEMQSKYPDADFTLTGHSLGGAKRNMQLCILG
ncbi:lipase family protein [Paenibacillus xylanexedens]|uniref:lipase family protein n=1 Tax=Paenibacillus xylanexedens TaxID=528191 RepID=UPI003144EFD7